MDKLTQQHLDIIRDNVSKRVSSLLEDGNMHPSQKPKLFASVWVTLNKRFNVSSYKDIPDNKFVEVCHVINNIRLA